jgi:hypothetical protein
MRAPFHHSRRLSPLEKEIEAVRAEFEPGHFATVEAALLRPSDVEETRAGTKPLYGLTDERGRRYALKLGRPELMAAEHAAYELRSLGKRPCLPSRVIDIELEGQGPVTGLLKPFIEFEIERELPADTQSWSELQRSVILLEHAWEWLLDNSDTNTSQYALIGENDYPLNIDWDRSFSTEARSTLSRFDKYKVILPNARTFLYSDYVEGKVDLPFSVLHAEARRIRRLPVAGVRRILERYAAVRYEDPLESAAFVTRALERQRTIESDFKRFVRDLLSERLALSVVPEKTVEARLRQGMVLVWNRGQHVLQHVSRGPVGTGGRKLLRHVRTKLWFGPPRTT